MNQLGGVSVAMLTLVATGLYVGTAHADWYAHADFSACPSQYVPESSGQEGPFSSEQECEARIQSVESSSPMACAQYSCEDDGSDSGSDSSGSGLSSLPPYTGGLSSQQEAALGMGMIGAYMVGKGLHDLLYGNPQQQAAQRAQEAAREMEQKRQAAEKAKQAEAIKEQLLGEIQGSGTGSTQLSLMGTTPESNLQLMTGGDALAPMTGSVNQAAPKVPTSGKKKAKHTDAFNKGYFDGSQCYSQHAGPYCYGKTDNTCVADYRAGYEVGTKEMKMRLVDATKLGLLDEESGSPNNGFNEMPATGGCQIELNEAYNKGYTQGQQAKTTATNRQGH